MTLPNDIDTGVFALPATRPSTFTPASMISGGSLTRPLDTVDTGTNTNPAPLANTFDNVANVPVTASPGY